MPEERSLLIRAAVDADVIHVASLLRTSSLPTDGLEELPGTLLVAEMEGSLVACAGIERYGSDALLRSVAVAETVRGSGIGSRIVDAIVERARRASISRLYLLTETPEQFFSRREFVRVDRDRIPAAVLGSAEFTSLCPDSAIAMMRQV